MKKFYVVLGVVAVGCAAAVWYAMRGGGTPVIEPIDLGEIEDQDVLDRAPVATAGNPDAQITIVEFGDYQCPGCRSWGSSVKPLIDLTYVDEGIAKFQYRDYPLIDLHDHAFLAARASWCADDQGQYWPYHEALFDSQGEWSSSTNASRHFNRLARELGLDRGDFRRCLASDRHAEAVTAAMMLGQRYGIGGTPTIVVDLGDGRPLRLGAADFGTIQEVIEAAREN